MGPRTGLDLTDEELLLAYADNEAAVERDTPERCTPRSWPKPSAGPAERLGREVSEEWAQSSARRCRTGRRFPTLPRRWRRLAKDYKLIILSNVHRDGFAGSNATAGR